MNIRDLKRLLNSKGIREEEYSLSGGHPDNRCVLSPEANGKWAVYYTERGIRIDEREFDSEHEACQALLSMLFNGPDVPT